VHTQSHLDAVREHCEAGVAFDADTPVGAGSLEAALHAAGGACALVDALLGGEAATGFCATRPPGHHAEPGRAMGFCLFSNVAVAARHALAAHGVERVLILDWDVHHGNGTAAAFHTAPEVLYVSIHQWPFYPGTGASADAGAGPGEGYTVNLPVPAGAGEDEWLGVVEHVVVPVARSFAPDLLLLSAGFDAHREDPLADCRLEAVSFAHMARHVHALAGELGVAVGAVLEGGYDLGALSASVAATMEAMAEGGPPRSVPRESLTDAAREQLSRYLPL